MSEPSAPAGERIARRLSRAGIASRREAERLVAEGRVRICGRLCESPAERVTAADPVEVDGRPVALPGPGRLWRYYKSVDILVTRSDAHGRRKLADELPAELASLMPVGRLDLASEGLLLLTDDGALKRRLELPANGYQRVYRARVRGWPDAEALRPAGRGLVIRGERFRPMGVEIEQQEKSNTWLRISLCEGRYREVRRALAHLGFPVNRLVRIAYGPFSLGSLARGAVAEVPPAQVRRLESSPPVAR